MQPQQPSHARPVVTGRLRGVFASALMEDVVVIAAQQRSIDALGDRPAIDLNVDHGAHQARRLLERRIGEEARAGAG